MLDGIIITALGGVARVQVDGLADMQRAVSGWIECVVIRVGEHTCSMYLNEDGKALALPANARATHYGIQAGIMPGDYIAGDVLIIGDVDDEGESLSIHPDAAALLMAKDATEFSPLDAPDPEWDGSAPLS